MKATGKQHWINIIKISFFLILLCVLFVLQCFIYQPVWPEWNNYETIKGFYLEPENTIETIFLGPSTVINGISPMEIYEQYGYCTYNLGTEAQPVLASYYWLKEAYRLHKDSLKVVFFDPSCMRWGIESWGLDIVYYQKAIDEMQESPVKMEAIAAYRGLLSNRKGEPNTVSEGAISKLNTTIEYAVPLFEYHDRWDSFSEIDDEKAGMKPKGETRGYSLSAGKYIDTGEYEDLGVEHSWYDPKAEPAGLNEEALVYFDKMVSFCEEKGLHLVIAGVTRPNYGWDNYLHNSVRELAEGYGIPYYDLNASPLLDNLDFVMGYDHIDNHLNYYGAKKVTGWFGKYLNENSLNTDISGQDGYQFMEEQLEAYHSLIRRSITLKDSDDIAEYLSEASKLEHCYVLISIKDDGSMSLTEEQRAKFANLGLMGLSELGERESYIGVLKDGRVDAELRDELPPEEETPEGYLQYSFDENIIILSGGFNHGNLSSIQINGTEYSPNQRGINIVVYDYTENEIYDSTFFDTCASPSRLANVELAYQNLLEQEAENHNAEDTEKHALDLNSMDERVRKLYLYNRRYRNQQYADYWQIYGDETSVFAYLEPYLKEPGYSVFISVKDEAALNLTEEAREAFSEMGFQELSQLATRECYIGILDEGTVYYEQRALGAEPLVYREIDYSVVSGGFESGNISSVMICGGEESLNERGLNIVVYDKRLQQVVSKAAFDTHEQAPSISTDLGVERTYELY